MKKNKKREQKETKENNKNPDIVKYAGIPYLFNHPRP